MKKIFVIMAAAMLMMSTSCTEQKKANAHQEATEPATEQIAQDSTIQEEPAVKDIQEGSTVRTLDRNVRGIDILPAIIKKYEGKVVLVDFWATWCPPCRKAMKDVDLIKKDFLAKGVHFVYITGETSPEEDWNQMITEIEGDHYRLTNEQWSELCTSLEIPGIPAYMLISKQGSVAYDNLKQGGYPGNEKVSAEIEQALKK